MYSQTFRASICWQFGREFFKATLETLNYKWEQINQCRAKAGRIRCCCSLNCALRDGERKIDQSLLPGWNVAAAKRVLWFPRKSFIRLLEKIKAEHRRHSASFQCACVSSAWHLIDPWQQGKEREGAANQFKVFPCLTLSSVAAHFNL